MEIILSLLVIIVIFIIQFLYRKPVQNIPAKSSRSKSKQIIIYYATHGGKSKKFVHKILAKLNQEDVAVKNLSDWNPETEHELWSKALWVIMVVPTYESSVVPPDAEWFYKSLEDTAFDFRFPKNMFSASFFVVGLGDSSYEDNFCKAAKNVDKWLGLIGLHRTAPLQTLDDQFPNKDKHVLNSCIRSLYCGTKSTTTASVRDIEDLADFVQTRPGKKQEMLTPVIRKNLEKQGYNIVGSHSGVKLCRWTKYMLRGRGGCYKHSFYGIASHQCMEATPSLACANKCVFCWRHHTNPTGTEWKWEMDDPDRIVQQFMAGHKKMIKSYKGVPGVTPDRMEEALSIRHCALSLVGEPIMYPKINRVAQLLHKEQISTFLVTNGQFPEAIANMCPVTQLYVSIDASNREDLRKIDRPLFKDFWERFIRSLQYLSRRMERTVYRLTVVKGWNNRDISGYGSLVTIGSPSFVEIKGVTYSGENDEGISMENIPWHSEVLDFSQRLLSHIGDDYGLASEHEHSNCVLIANKKFLHEDGWHTWIDFSEFHRLYDEYVETGIGFSAGDYSKVTPSWAQYGAEEKGFDPEHQRFYRKTKTIAP